MEVIVKGFNDKDVANRVKAVCEERINKGLSALNDFGRLWGITYDIAYRGDGVIEIIND